MKTQDNSALLDDLLSKPSMGLNCTIWAMVLQTQAVWWVDQAGRGQRRAARSRTKLFNGKSEKLDFRAQKAF